MWTKMGRALAAPLLLATVLGAPGQASGAPVLYSFKGKRGGAGPQAGLISDASGTLYGATCRTVKANAGVVFSLTPPAAGMSGWTFATLYKFTKDVNGFRPCGTLWRRADGALFGTTEGGGGGAGTLFKLDPPLPGKTAWREHVLHAFILDPTDGATPEGSLIADAQGRLFGTTIQGGLGCASNGGCGTVFMMTPPAGGSGSWTESVIYFFDGQTGQDGFPGPDLAWAGTGVLVGTTANSVFSLTETAPGVWHYAKLAIAPALPARVAGGVAVGADGSLYGVTAQGGANNNGSVFALHLPAVAGDPWSSVLIHEFSAYSGNTDGYSPSTTLRMDGNGSLYGTAPDGGSVDSGVLFRMDPPAAGGTAWAFQVLTDFSLTSFKGARDPVAPVMLLQGSAWLPTSFGGAGNDGAVVRVPEH